MLTGTLNHNTTIEPPHDKNNKNDTCVQRRLRSQSDQSLRCPNEETLGPYLPIGHTVKTDQIRWMPWLIWVFAMGTLIILLVLSRGSSVLKCWINTVYISVPVPRKFTVNCLRWCNFQANCMSRNMTKPIKWLCAQRRLRSAWASAQSDQNLRCPQEEALDP